MFLNALLAFDRELFLAINNWAHPPFLVFLAKFLSGTNELKIIWLFLVLLFLARKHFSVIIELFLSLISVSFINMCLLKQLINRLRPEFLLENVNVYIKTSDYLSFPSNHAATAFAAAVVLTNAFPKGKYWFFLLAFLIAFSRVYLGVHYPLDIVSGALLGWGAGLLVVRLARLPSKKLVLGLLVGFFVLFSAKPVLAKTVLVVEPENISVYQDQPVLGISSDSSKKEEEKIDKLNLKEQNLEVNPNQNKLQVLLKETGGKILGSQEVDQLYIKDKNNLLLTVENEQVTLKEKLAWAVSRFPVIIKQSTLELLARTPQGEKLLKITPEEAVAEIEKLGGLDPEKVPVKLELKDDGVKLVYVLSQKEEKKLFGFIPISAEVTTTVSAETGKVENNTSPWYFKFLTNLSV